jgi:hypothetical protein
MARQDGPRLQPNGPCILHGLGLVELFLLPALAPILVARGRYLNGSSKFSLHFLDTPLPQELNLRGMGSKGGKVEELIKSIECTRAKLSGTCIGCGQYQAGNLLLKIEEQDGVPLLLLGVEGEGDNTLHVLAMTPISKIPGASCLPPAIPAVIQ